MYLLWGKTVLSNILSLALKFLPNVLNKEKEYCLPTDN